MVLAGMPVLGGMLGARRDACARRDAGTRRDAGR